MSRQLNRKPTDATSLRAADNLIKLRARLRQMESDIVRRRNEFLSGVRYFHRSSEWPDILSPGDVYSNDCRPDSFLVTRLNSSKHPGRLVCSLKPNLRDVGFLYRGQRKYYPRCVPSMFRDPDKRYFADSVVLAQEFRLNLETHPLYRLLWRGINLGGHDVIIEMDPYGLAQHYGFHTAVTDFTSDFDVAAFFATTESSHNGVHQPVKSSDSYGVLYLLPLDGKSQPFAPGPDRYHFSTIGLQLFPRSGMQRGFLLNVGNTPMADLHNDNRFMHAFFRHDPNVSRHYINRFSGADSLFPPDVAQCIADRILSTRTVSEAVVLENIRDNPHNTEDQIRQCLHDNGIKVDPNLTPSLTPDELDMVRADIRNGLWDEFVSRIEFPLTDITLKRRLEAELRAVPFNPLYSHAFDF